MGAPLPVREFASAEEMRAHYALVRARTGTATAPAARPFKAPRLIAPIATEFRAEPLKVWSQPHVHEQLEIVTPAELAGIAEMSGRDVIRVLEDVTGFPMVEIKSRRRPAHLVKARHIGFWLASKRTGQSYPQIGRLFGDVDHTTVMHGVRKVRAVMDMLGIHHADDAHVMAARLWNASWPSLSHAALKAAR